MGVDKTSRVGIGPTFTREVAVARVRARWSVTITIRDVRAVRELALVTCPVTAVDARTEIERSFAVAWRRAAAPCALIRGQIGTDSAGCLPVLSRDLCTSSRRGPSVSCGLTVER